MFDPLRQQGADPARRGHHGPFSTLGEAYNAIGRWITDSGCCITGSCREIYLEPAILISQTDPDTMTEIQFPLEKTAKQPARTAVNKLSAWQDNSCQAHQIDRV